VTPEFPATPVPEAPLPPRTGSLLREGWGVAAKEAAKLLVWMVALGQLLSFGLFLTSDGVGDFLDYAKGGGVYFATFHRIWILVDLSGFGGGALGIPDVPASGFDLTYRLSAGLLLGTIFLGWLAYRAGRRASERTRGGPVASAIRGAKVSIPYAVASFLLLLLVRFDVRAPLEPVATGNVTIRVSPIQSFLLPLVIVAVPAAIGGLLTMRGAVVGWPWGRRTLASAAGGARMLVLGTAFSLAGLVVAGWVQPGEPVSYLAPTTPAYLRGAFEQGPIDGLETVVNHLLVLPNESVFVLVPAMGGCDEVSVAGFSVKLLCYSNFPDEAALRIFAAQAATGAPGTSLDGSTAPAGYFLFLFAPALAALLGGRVAARRGEARSRQEAVALGAGSGVVFAVLATIAAVMSRLTVGLAAEAGFAFDVSVAFGPPVAQAGLLGLAWGVIGGALGGALGGAQAPPVPEPPPVPGWSSPPKLPPPPGP